MKHLLFCIKEAARHPRTALLGVKEFRLTSTTNPGEDLIEAYDAGRELAHLVTFRRFDPTVY